MEEGPTVLVWPWVSSDLKYNAFLDTFIGQECPSVPKLIYPEECIYDSNHPKPTELATRAECCANFHVTTLKLMVMAETGQESLLASDPARSAFMNVLRRKRSLLSVTASDLACLIIIIGDESKAEPIKAFEYDAVQLISFIKNRDLRHTPAFVICLDDSDCAMGPALRDYVKALNTFPDYKGDWVFKSISSKPSVAELNELITAILAEAETMKAQTEKASAEMRTLAPVTRTRKARRSGCTIA